MNNREWDKQYRQTPEYKKYRMEYELKKRWGTIDREEIEKLKLLKKGVQTQDDLIKNRKERKRELERNRYLKLREAKTYSQIVKDRKNNTSVASVRSKKSWDTRLLKKWGTTDREEIKKLIIKERKDKYFQNSGFKYDRKYFISPYIRIFKKLTHEEILKWIELKENSVKTVRTKFVRTKYNEIPSEIIKKYPHVNNRYFKKIFSNKTEEEILKWIELKENSVKTVRTKFVRTKYNEIPSEIIKKYPHVNNRYFKKIFSNKTEEEILNYLNKKNKKIENIKINNTLTESDLINKIKEKNPNYFKINQWDSED